MAQEDDLRALGKIMDFLRAVSIILAIMNVYWYCYEAMRMWGVTIGVVDRKDELEQDLDGSCCWLLLVLPQLVDIIVAYI